MVYRAEGSIVKGNVSFGKDCSVWYNAVIRGEDTSITIGNRVNIQDNCVIHGDHGTPVSIGNDVTIGHGAIIHGCTIEDECLIGMGAIIMNRAVIHKHCIVAAGALVSEGKEFAEGSLIMGVPAKAVRPLSEEEQAVFRLSSQHYVEHAKKELLDS